VEILNLILTYKVVSFVHLKKSMVKMKEFVKIVIQVSRNIPIQLDLQIVKEYVNLLKS
jgi:hypothetical protein